MKFLLDLYGRFASTVICFVALVTTMMDYGIYLGIRDEGILVRVSSVFLHYLPNKF